MRIPRKADFIEVGAYIAAVARHFIAFGWFVLAGVLGVISEFTGSLDFFPTWGWWTIAMTGLTVAQFRAYHDVRAIAHEASVRAGDLVDDSTKRAYLEEQIAESRRLAEEAEELEREQEWWMNRPRMHQDIVHWESGVRATLRQWFPKGTDRLFDSEEGLEVEERVGLIDEAKRSIGYLRRRRIRLEQIRDDL